MLNGPTDTVRLQTTARTQTLSSRPAKRTCRNLRTKRSLGRVPCAPFIAHAFLQAAERERAKEVLDEAERKVLKKQDVMGMNTLTSFRASWLGRGGLRRWRRRLRL